MANEGQPTTQEQLDGAIDWLWKMMEDWWGFPSVLSIRVVSDTASVDIAKVLSAWDLQIKFPNLG
jgi:hypothetical protein